jgi:hypothetical protein
MAIRLDAGLKKRGVMIIIHRKEIPVPGIFNRRKMYVVFNCRN